MFNKSNLTNRFASSSISSTHILLHNCTIQSKAYMFDSKNSLNVHRTILDFAFVKRRIRLCQIQLLFILSRDFLLCENNRKLGFKYERIFWADCLGTYQSIQFLHFFFSSYLLQIFIKSIKPVNLANLLLRVFPNRLHLMRALKTRKCLLNLCVSFVAVAFRRSTHKNFIRSFLYNDMKLGGCERRS